MRYFEITIYNNNRIIIETYKVYEKNVMKAKKLATEILADRTRTVGFSFAVTEILTT